MNLLVDIGNTRCKWALARGTALIETGVVVRAGNADWLEALPRTSVEAVHVSSVAQPEALAHLREFAVRRGANLRVAVSSSRSGDLINAYDQPERLGVDRWMACIAARTAGRGSVLVADAGTALTLDFVDADGRHQGGLITPGVATMRSGQGLAGCQGGWPPSAKAGPAPNIRATSSLTFTQILLLGGNSVIADS